MLLLLSVFALTFDGLLSQTLLPFEYIYVCVVPLSLSLRFGNGNDYRFPSRRHWDGWKIGHLETPFGILRFPLLRYYKSQMG